VQNGIIPDSLGQLLTAFVIISMALMPLLGKAADFIGKRLDVQEAVKAKEQWFSRENGGSIAYDVGTIDPSDAANMRMQMLPGRPMPPSLLGGGMTIPGGQQQW
jgi:hypothetical protein